MRLEDVKPGRWVIYTAGHPHHGDKDRIGQIGRIVGFCKKPKGTTKDERNIEVKWLRALHKYPHGGGVFRENIELIGPVE